MMLIEADKRSADWWVQLAYSKAGEKEFYVPENVHIIGTMNTADRSISLVDYALRRRFAFLDIEPGFDSKEFEDSLKNDGVSAELVERIVTTMGELNKTIRIDPTLGGGYCIGHSYFCGGQGKVRDEAWLDRVIELEVIPLLQEYWRDSPGKLDTAKSLLQDEG